MGRLFECVGIDVAASRRNFSNLFFRTSTSSSIMTKLGDDVLSPGTVAAGVAGPAVCGNANASDTPSDMEPPVVGLSESTDRWLTSRPQPVR